MPPLLDLLLHVVLGLGAGVVAGLFGVGGGIVMVPVLYYVAGLPFVLSTQISLLVIAVNTPFGLYRQHVHHHNVLWQKGLLLTAGGAVGVAVAMLLRPFVPVDALKFLFALVGTFAAYRMFRPVRVAPHDASVLWLLPAGLAAGAAAHWLGIGGGLLMVPVLVFLGVSIHQAVATSLVAVFTNAAVSTLFDLPVLVHHLPVAGALALGAIVGIRAGVHLGNLTGAVRLRRGFAIFLFAMALYILIDTLWT